MITSHLICQLIIKQLFYEEQLFYDKNIIKQFDRKNNNRIRVATLFVDWEQEWTQNFRQLARSLFSIYQYIQIVHSWKFCTLAIDFSAKVDLGKSFYK